MKIRVTGLALAGLAAATLTLSAFAATADESGTVAGGLSGVEATEPETPIYLDGEAADTLAYQVYNSVYYVTVESFVTALDSETMVEEEDGTVTVNAVTVTEVVDVESEEGAEASYTEGDAVGEANVVEETLCLTAQSGAYCAVANGRCLYVENGIIQVDGKVALPIRVLAKVFNLTVEYDGETKTVQLAHQEDASAYLADGDSYYDSDTLYWLSRIISAESGNQPLKGKLAVGNVVMNRVASPLFPNNIYDVLFQRSQFSPASSGSIYRTPGAESVLAAKMVLDGAEVVKGALFFNRVGLNSYAARNRSYVATIGAHVFYN